MISFGLAYIAEFSLTAGSLVQEDVSLSMALWVAFTYKSAIITVMEVAAIGMDILLAGNSRIDDTIFWNSLILSLTVGLLADSQVNVILVRLGEKKCMHSPKEMAHHGHG